MDGIVQGVCSAMPSPYAVLAMVPGDGKWSSSLDLTEFPSKLPDAILRACNQQQAAKLNHQRHPGNLPELAELVGDDYLASNPGAYPSTWNDKSRRDDPRTIRLWLETALLCCELARRISWLALPPYSAAAGWCLWGTPPSSNSV